MIVKCEQCQTRFKIPDEKVTDKGVKVRCNKCGHTFRVTRDMAQPASPSQQLPSVPPADPFARFGAPRSEPPPGEVTRPGVFTLGVEASRNPDLGNKKPSAPAPAPAFDFGALAPPSVPALGSAPPPPPFPAAAAPPKPPPAPASAFDFSAIAPPPASSAATTQAPAFDFSAIAPPSASSAPTTQTPAFDFSAFAAPGSTAAPAPAAFDFAALGAPAVSEAPTASQAFDFGPPPSAPPPPPPAREEKTQVARPFGNDGFLGDNAPAPALPSFDGATARAMFDMPAPSASALPELPPPEPEDYSPQPTASLPKQSVPTMPAAPTPELLAASEKPKSRRGVVGVFVNIVIAGLLVLGLVVVGSAYLNDGKFSAESLSVEQLKNTFAPSVPFVASDVTNGLYDTRAGRAVFYVRGEVANRSDAPATLVVKAEIVENGKVVRAAESYVTETPPSVEELYAVDGTDALEALQRRVEKRAAAVPPGGTASFVVAFTEYPPDLKGFRVRVSARPVATPTATR